MFTIISFILTILGCINWLMVGLLQYDFVAGIFGYQASIFSRIIYIIIGAASIFLVFKLFKGKGTIAVFSRRNKKDLAKNIEKMNKKDSEKEYSPDEDFVPARQHARVHNVEASREHVMDDYDREDYDDIPSNSSRGFEEERRGLFDEHFDK